MLQSWALFGILSRFYGTCVQCSYTYSMKRNAIICISQFGCVVCNHYPIQLNYCRFCWFSSVIGEVWNVLNFKVCAAINISQRLQHNQIFVQKMCDCSFGKKIRMEKIKQSNSRIQTFIEIQTHEHELKWKWKWSLEPQHPASILTVLIMLWSVALCVRCQAKWNTKYVFWMICNFVLAS